MRQTFCHRSSWALRCWHEDWKATFQRLFHIQSIWDCQCVAMNNSASKRTCRKPKDCDYTHAAPWWSYDNHFQFGPSARRSRRFSVAPPIRLSAAASSWSSTADRCDLCLWEDDKKSFEILVRWSLNRVCILLLRRTKFSSWDRFHSSTLRLHQHPPTPSKTDTTRTPPSRWCEHKCEKWNACACNFNQLRKQQRRRQIPNKFSTLTELFQFISSTSVRMLSRGNCNLKIWRKVILWRRLSLSPAS